jgi:hypothetical protein
LGSGWKGLLPDYSFLCYNIIDKDDELCKNNLTKKALKKTTLPTPTALSNSSFSALR